MAAGEAAISSFQWIDTVTTAGVTISVLLVGDEDGVLRVHHDGSVIMEQTLWRSPVLGITASGGTNPSQPDGVLVLHQDGVVCYLEGSVLFGAIQAALLGHGMLHGTPLHLSRWSLGTQSVTAAFCGSALSSAAGLHSTGRPTDSLPLFAVGAAPVIAVYQALPEPVASCLPTTHTTLATVLKLPLHCRSKSAPQP